MELSFNRIMAFAALLAIATMNRELTGVLLWLMVAVAYPRQWQLWLGYGMLFVAVFGLLRFMIAAEPSPYTIAYTWQLNLTDWRLQGAILYQTMLLPVWIYLYANGKHPLRRPVVLVLLPYAVLVALLGVWQETRLMMPFLIFGIPFLRETDGQ